MRVLFISGLDLQAQETNDAPAHTDLLTKWWALEGGKKKSYFSQGTPGCRACLSRLPICFLLTYCNTCKVGLQRRQEPQGFRWLFSGPAPPPTSKQPSAVCGAVAQPKQCGNNTPSVESTEQNKALMKLLQAFQMPVHINVLLGSTQSEIRRSGSQPGNGLSFSSPFPAQWKSLRTQGCSAGCAAGCQEEGGSLGLFLCNFGKERQDKLCFVL